MFVPASRELARKPARAVHPRGCDRRTVNEGANIRFGRLGGAFDYGRGGKDGFMRIPEKISFRRTARQFLANIGQRSLEIAQNHVEPKEKGLAICFSYKWFMRDE